MQPSNNKTKRTRKSAEESVAAPSEASRAQQEESSKTRQKRTAKKPSESAPATTSHRRVAKKANDTISEAIPTNESVVEHRSTAASPAIAHHLRASRSMKHEDIARLAYSYWERRGYQGGSSMEDWLRAEHELRLS